ncbi:hypothetical protein L1887_05304 [Cichorium endivia]|nr:hypothetical protein L1887_05304 [Cichorium endivia]
MSLSSTVGRQLRTALPLFRFRERNRPQSSTQVIEQWVQVDECRTRQKTKIPLTESRTKNHRSQSANSRKQSRPIVSIDPLSVHSRTSSTTSQSPLSSTTSRQITSLPSLTLSPTSHGQCTGPYKAAC